MFGPIAGNQVLIRCPFAQQAGGIGVGMTAVMTRVTVRNASVDALGSVGVRIGG